MPAHRVYPPALMDRGVQIVLQLKRESPDRVGVVRQVGELLGIHPEALRHWVKRAEALSLPSPAVRPTREPSQSHVRRLEQEIVELRRANGILISAAALFAAEMRRDLGDRVDSRSAIT